MRLASEKKAGFYPLHPSVVPLICQHIRPPNAPWSALDPCAGKSEAFNLLVPPDVGAKRYAIELDAGRTRTSRELMPDAEVLGPADSLTARVSSGTFGLVYCNPPYAENRGNDRGRMEAQFLNRSLAWLKSQGILIAVVPEHQITGSHYAEPDFVRILRHSFREIRIIPVPEEHRNFNEVIVFGIRRAQSLTHGTAAKLGGNSWAYDWSDIPIYDIPESYEPRLWEKVGLTPAECHEEFLKSPLNKLFDPPEIKPLGRPLLPLSRGHLALCIVSGANNGVVNPPDGKDHVIRGVAKKEEYEKSKEQSESQDGKAIITKTVRSERIKVVVRALYRDGSIVNYE